MREKPLSLREVKVWWVIGTEFFFFIVKTIITYLTEFIYLILLMFAENKIPFNVENPIFLNGYM